MKGKRANENDESQYSICFIFLTYFDICSRSKDIYQSKKIDERINETHAQRSGHLKMRVKSK
jgi:hypothetical protein